MENERNSETKLAEADQRKHSHWFLKRKIE